MSIINLTKSVLFFLLLSFSIEECVENSNNCIKCDPLTNLCAECEKNIYKPDSKGGCEPSKQCNLGENFCNLCDQSNTLCSSCENGFFPDQNGGCSTTENCIISYKGECFQCDENYYLIGTNKVKFCKYKYTEDIQNCKTLNYETGLCKNCSDGYFLNSGDFKCIKTENCTESLFDVCTECNWGYYLDKRYDSCKIWDNIKYCKISLDGATCDECNKEYYFSNNEKCVYTKYCSKADEDNICQKCDDNYFLASNNVCTNDKNCLNGNKDFGTCNTCKNYYFYYDEDLKKCISNQEDNELKFCEIVKNNKCIKCQRDFELNTEGKCSKSKNCIQIKNGICTKCEENYHLGLDNLCTNIEKCIRSNEYESCVECDKNYYYDNIHKKCFLEMNQYKNCKISKYNEQYCETCKNGYYLYKPKNICYDNSKEGPLYKCAISDIEGNSCIFCEENYFLGLEDSKCSKIDGCAISENENKCIKCEEDFCFDIKKGTCNINFFEPESDDEKIYYVCNITNEEGTECAQCINENYEIKNGVCYNKVDCAEEKNGECVKCNEMDEFGLKRCLNSVYGCVETFLSNCLKCDNILDFNECTECIEGYELSDNNKCVKI